MLQIWPVPTYKCKLLKDRIPPPRHKFLNQILAYLSKMAFSYTSVLRSALQTKNHRCFLLGIFLDLGYWLMVLQ